MSGFEANAETLANAATDVDQTSAEVNSLLAQLRSTVENTGSTWQGGAASAFNNLMLRFDQNAQNLNKALGVIAQELRGTGQSYLQNEEAQQAVFSPILARLT